MADEYLHIKAVILAWARNQCVDICIFRVTFVPIYNHQLRNKIFLSLKEDFLVVSSKETDKYKFLFADFFSLCFLRVNFMFMNGAE